MPLRECMRTHTNRECMAWLRWLEEQKNNPSRSDYYLMRIAAEVRKSWAKDPTKIQLNQFRINFVPPKQESEQPSLSHEERTAIAKARWFGFLNVRSK